MTRPRNIEKIKKVWPSLRQTLYVPHTLTQYNALVRLLDKLADEVGENEKHPLASLMEIISILIEKYEDEHVPELKK